MYVTFHVSIIAPTATMVVYGILFGGMHLICTYYHIYSFLSVKVIKKYQLLRYVFLIHNDLHFDIYKLSSQVII